MSKRIFLVPLSLLLFAGCGPKASRGGPDTENPQMDEGAMSTTLDRADIQYLVDQNLDSMFKSPFWGRDVQGSVGDPPVVAIWPIKNATSEHLDDQMLTLLSAIETKLVNSGAVNVVSRERQAEMAAEVGVQNTDSFDPATAAKLGRQVGAKYYITGKVTSVDERIKNTRRLQYTLFLQVIEVETSMIKFQFESERSKALKG
jgi:uncharacterized protein (TIGR02722 family)